jgi:hypothetical protein
VTRHERAYRRLLALYPAAFRARYEDEMVTAFTDQWRLAQAPASRGGIALLWLRTIGDVLSTAPGQHLRKGELVPRPVEMTAGVGIVEPDRWARARVAIALLPLWCAIVLWLRIPGFFDPLVDSRLSVVGMPAGRIVVFVIGLLVTCSVLLMLRSRSTAVHVIAFALLTGPSLVILVMAPSILLIAINLTT